MIGRLQKYLERKEQAFRASFGHDITDPKERRRSLWHYKWLDHGVLRRYWHNFEEFAPGAYRSNHPDHQRFERYAKMGIKAVLNLRGVQKQPHYLFEEESCRQLGLDLITVHMGARSAPLRDILSLLLDVFEEIDRPFLMHCKSGADRTGLAAALYMMVQEGKSVKEARKQLSFRYLHIRRIRTGILDHFLDVYEARNAQDPIDIRDWIATEYDADALQASFDAKQASLRFWQGWR
ncbi:fused DSP-PTPase phosphatase/NAD kinase-like protein [Yoonia sp. 2307UL14-13]|uniref:fused DSP-PTPase phosphatase/NAD kinase-like protein n=1 Tax=Yoonia sp. 2307UL14-13 TaxID=3126506 RepID=UPI0030A0477D